MHQDPYWIIFGDIHDKTKYLGRISELHDAQGVIITGDLTFIGGIEKAQQVVSCISKRNANVYAQIGNMDTAIVNTWLEAQGVNIHTKRTLLHENIVMLGIGGSVITPFETPSEFPEEQYTAWLEAMHEEALSFHKDNEEKPPHFLLISHNPPFNTNCDALTNGTHVGSTAVRKYIVEYQPSICLCGHIHEAKSEDWLGKTHIINPGAFMDGGYVVLTYSPSTNTLTAALRDARGNSTK